MVLGATKWRENKRKQKDPGFAPGPGPGKTLMKKRLSFRCRINKQNCCWKDFPLDGDVKKRPQKVSAILARSASK